MATLQEIIENVKQELRDEFEQKLAEEREGFRIQLVELQRRDGGELPPHFHKLDRINFQDLAGGMKTFDSTPTHVAENGKPLVYTVGSTSYLAVKVGSTWKKTTLTNV